MDQDKNLGKIQRKVSDIMGLFSTLWIGVDKVKN